MTATPDIAPGRLTPDLYAENFSDLHPAFDRHEARVAAERCLFCYDAPCIKACPTSIDIPLFIREIITGNTVGSAKTILDANIFGGMCARVCPTETLCEEACVRNAAEDNPVEIGNLQRYATDDLLRRAGSSTSAARRPAAASPWSAPGRRASPAPTAWRCSATRSSSSRRATSRAALTNTASRPTRAPTISPSPKSTTSSPSAASQSSTASGSAATSRSPG